MTRSRDNYLENRRPMNFSDYKITRLIDPVFADDVARFYGITGARLLAWKVRAASRVLFLRLAR